MRNKFNRSCVYLHGRGGGRDIFTQQMKGAKSCRYAFYVTIEWSKLSFLIKILGFSKKFVKCLLYFVANVYIKNIFYQLLLPTRILPNFNRLIFLVNYLSAVFFPIFVLNKCLQNEINCLLDALQQNHFPTFHFILNAVAPAFHKPHCNATHTKQLTYTKIII